jgi:hypothetical protein
VLDSPALKELDMIVEIPPEEVRGGHKAFKAHEK